MKNKRGRKRVGPTISVALTDDQLQWINAMIPAGGTRAEVIRRLLQVSMEKEKNGSHDPNHQTSSDGI